MGSYASLSACIVTRLKLLEIIIYWDWGSRSLVKGQGHQVKKSDFKSHFTLELRSGSYMPRSNVTLVKVKKSREVDPGG